MDEMDFLLDEMESRSKQLGVIINELEEKIQALKDQDESPIP